MALDPKVMKQNLYNTLVRALESVVADLEPYVRSRKVPKEPMTEARRRAEGGYIHKHYHRSDYSGLAATHCTEWAKLPEVEKAVGEFVCDADIQKEFRTVGFGNLCDYVTTQIVHQFIYRVLHLTRRWPPRRSAIDSLFFQ